MTAAFGDGFPGFIRESCPEEASIMAREDQSRYPVSIVWENANMGITGAMGRIGENALYV